MTDGTRHTPGVVSIWAGHLPDENALDDYVTFRYPPDGPGWSPFTRDHGLDWFDDDQTEAAWFAAGPYSLAAHSYGESFSQAADAELLQRFPDANSVYLVYELDANVVPVRGPFDL